MTSGAWRRNATGAADGFEKLPMGRNETLGRCWVRTHRKWERSPPVVRWRACAFFLGQEEERQRIPSAELVFGGRRMAKDSVPDFVPGCLVGRAWIYKPSGLGTVHCCPEMLSRCYTATRVRRPKPSAANTDAISYYNIL